MINKDQKKFSIITYQFRIKDESCLAILQKKANAVNFLWNYCNDASYYMIRNYSRWLSKYDFNPLVRGSAKDLGLHSQTVQLVAYEYVTRRDQFQKNKLRWRGRKNLGWIPLGKDGIRIQDDVLVHNKNEFRFWKSRAIEGKIKCGSFSQDTRDRWYLNLQCEVVEKRIAGPGEVGIDLGLKTFATESNGRKTEISGWFRKYEHKLGKAQQKKDKTQVKTLHAKIANKRKDDLHKLSDRLVRENRLIVIGDVGGKKLIQTTMAKSVLDAGWSNFRNMREAKSIRRQGVVIIVNEHNTTQVCSNCGVKPDSAPKGLAGLALRVWGCSHCGESHDRDENAAKNILRLGQQKLLAKG